MISASKPIVRNIKVGFRYDNKRKSSSEIKEILTLLNSKHLHNFSILRNKYIYSIFWTGGYINITGINTEKEIITARDHIKNLLQIEEILGPTQIHNICASGKLSSTVNLEKIREHLTKFTDYKTILNLSYFPALFFTIKNLGFCTELS